MSLETRIQEVLTQIGTDVGNKPSSSDVDILIAAYILANPPSAAPKEYASFYLDSGGLTGISNTVRTLVIDNTRNNSNATVFVLALNELTVNKTGDYKISFDTYINNSATSRTEYSIWIEVNGTGIVGGRSAVYQRGYDSGQSTMYNDIVSLTTGDKIRFRIQRTDGGSTAGYQDNDGTRLTIEEK